MNAPWMHPIGLAMAAIGAVGILVGQVQIARALAALPPAIRDKPLTREQRLKSGPVVAVIAVAIAIYLGARELGLGQLGLYVCVAMLVVNSGFAARQRADWLHRIVGDPALEHPYRRAVRLQLYAAWVTWTGCAIWLLRP